MQLVLEHSLADEAGEAVEAALIMARSLGPGRVGLAGPRQPSAEDLSRLLSLGVAVSSELSVPEGAEAWLDVWTCEVDERVLRLRQRGIRTACLADRVLQLHRDRMVGITGTAGKTTTAWLVRQLLRGLVPRVAASTARAGNLWPGPSLLSAAAGEAVVAELTSSHLAFCHHSPAVAAITNLWPDHLELHGGWLAYKIAKSRLFRFQQAQDAAVLPGDDAGAADLARGSKARRAWFALGQEPPAGEVRVWTTAREVCVDDHLRLPLASLPPWLSGEVRLRALVCALATSLAAAQVLPDARCRKEALVEALPGLQLPPHRGSLLSPPGWPVTVLDHTLAATPRKARAAVPPGCHVVAGGLLEVGGRAVHASPPERLALEGWIEALVGCRSLDLFGPGGRALDLRLRERLSPPRALHEGVLEAVRAAVGRAAPGGTVVVAPGFPMSQADREEVASYSPG